MTRGGKRAGAGRKEIDNPKKSVTVRLRPDLAAWLKKTARPGKSQADLIEKALIECYNLETSKNRKGLT